MEETISLKDIFNIIKKRIFIIISFTLIAGILSGVYSYFMTTPLYQTSTQILINQQYSEEDKIYAQDIQTNLQLINTYNVIIKSPAILEKVIEKLELDLTAEQLARQISITSVEDSQVVDLYVKDTEHYRAVDIANTIAEVFQQEVPTLMNISESNVNILTPAKHKDFPDHVYPSEIKNIAIAAVVGLMLGVGLAFLLEYLDTTIKTEEDAEELLDLPIIGIVSPIPEKLRTSVENKPTDQIANRSRRGKLV